MKQFVMKIDGMEVKANEDDTILQAARRAGIEIPTLCHDDRLSFYGACRLCSVEIGSFNRARIVASCVYPAEDGLIVQTQSQRVWRIRKMIMQLIEAVSPGLGAELEEKYGVEKTKFDKEPVFCILCGMCVRYCSEVKKANALGFVGRGIERQVVFYPEIAVKTCPTCRECIHVCPTGVIPSDFMVSVPHYEKLPSVYPVRLRDEKNVQSLLSRTG